MDPRLRFLQDQSANERAEFMESMRMARISTARRVASVEVIVRCRKGAGTKTHSAVEKKLKNMGFTVHAVVEGPAFVVSGSIGVDQLGDLLAEDWIELVEASHKLFPDLDLSGADVGVRPMQTVVPTVRGTNVLVGIIDGGIDFAHDDFRLPDGSSRIRFLWDQSARRFKADECRLGGNTQRQTSMLLYEQTRLQCRSITGILLDMGRTSRVSRPAMGENPTANSWAWHRTRNSCLLPREEMEGHWASQPRQWRHVDTWWIGRENWAGQSLLT